MHAVVFHNITDPDQRRMTGNVFAEYRPGNVLAQVDEFDMPGADPWVVLEDIFRIHNAVYGTERNVQMGLRSLSTGDAVALDGVLYECKSVGWERVEEAPQCDGSACVWVDQINAIDHSEDCSLNQKEGSA